MAMNLLEPASVRAAVAGTHRGHQPCHPHAVLALRMLLPWSWRENDRIRREGSAILAEAAIAAGVERLVQESFAPVFEDGGDRWIDEWLARSGRRRTTGPCSTRRHRPSASDGAGDCA